MNLDNITQFKFHFNLNVSKFNSEYKSVFCSSLGALFPTDLSPAYLTTHFSYITVALNPRTEKMTTEARMAVNQFTMDTMMASFSQLFFLGL